MATSTERARRYRAHKRGDHSLCAVERGCRTGVALAVTEPVTRDGVTAPAGLGPRGRRLWHELATVTTPPGQRVLMEEACRIADRLEQLDRVLRGDVATWVEIVHGEVETAVVVNDVLKEARRQAVALRQLVAEIRQSGVGKQMSGQQQGGSLRDQLAARRAARLANAAGS